MRLSLRLCVGQNPVVKSGPPFFLGRFQEVRPNALQLKPKNISVVAMPSTKTGPFISIISDYRRPVDYPPSLLLVRDVSPMYFSDAQKRLLCRY